MKKIYKNLTDAEWDILTSREVSVAELRSALESVAEDDDAAFNSKSFYNDINKVFIEKDPKTITMDIYVGGEKVVSDTKDIDHDYMSYDAEGNEYHEYVEADIDGFIGQSGFADSIYYSKDDHPIFDNEWEVLLTIFSESVCSEDMTIIISTDSGAVYEFNHSLAPWYRNLINIIKK